MDSLAECDECDEKGSEEIKDIVSILIQDNQESEMS